LNQTVSLRPKVTTSGTQTTTQSRQNMLRETKDGESIQAQFNLKPEQHKKLPR
jgi:hypothetical protein